MTTYIPKYEHDIFVSYADSDNQWVSTLVEGLRILLEQKLGEKNIFSFYLPEPTGKKNTDHPIKKSAVFLLVLSREYSKLEHCRNELNKIRSEVKENINRLIVVEKEPWQASEVILPVPTDSHIKFWVAEGRRKLPRTLGVPEPTPEEVEYYQRLYEVANRLEQELTISRAKASLTNLEQPAVFIDAAPQDLDSAEEIKVYLEKEDISCKPPINFDASPAEIRKELDGNLLSCRDIIIFCDSVPDIWVEEHIKYYRKVLLRRDNKEPVRNLIVFHRRMSESDKLKLSFPENLYKMITKIPEPLECYSLEECLPKVLKVLKELRP
jgi:hypothetical protein